jgi:rhodanese-related sulfurtransferase
MNLPVGMISAFAGWFIREGESLVLVASDEDQLEAAMTHLVRISLDNILGGYVGVVPAAAQGCDMNTIPMIGTEEVEKRLESMGTDWTLLDVRDADERAASAIDGSQHIYVGELNERYAELDPAKRYTLMCASGMRATVAAGWLASRSFPNLDVYLGSMGRVRRCGRHLYPVRRRIASHTYVRRVRHSPETGRPGSARRISPGATELRNWWPVQYGEPVHRAHAARAFLRLAHRESCEL